MELTQEEQQKLEVSQEILELKGSRPYQLWQKTVIESGVAECKRQLAEQRQPTWEHYLALWHRKEAFEDVQKSLSRIEAGAEALRTKAATKPDNSPATGELA